MLHGRYRGAGMPRYNRANDIDENEGGRRDVAREDMVRLLEDLRARPELNDLDDEQSMALAVSETRAARREVSREAEAPREADH
jgi:hypothetical protein